MTSSRTSSLVSRNLRFAVALALALGLALGPERPASASPEEPVASAIAQSLFDAGRALLDAGRIAEACEKFSQSQRLDPSAGTLLNLAICHEQEGKIASAWLEYSESWSIALREHRLDRAKIAEDRKAALEPRLSRLVIRSNAVAATILLDGREIPSDALDLAVPIDAGDHVLEARAPGREPFSRRLRISDDASTIEVLVPELARAAEAAPRRTATPEPKPERGPARRPPRPEASSSRRALAYVLAATSLTAGVGGAVFGVRALRYSARSDEACPVGRCSERGSDWSRRAAGNARIADVGFGLAVASAGAALYLWLSEPSAPPGSRAPDAAGGGVSLSVEGEKGVVAWRARF